MNNCLSMIELQDFACKITAACTVYCMSILKFKEINSVRTNIRRQFVQNKRHFLCRQVCVMVQTSCSSSSLVQLQHKAHRSHHECSNRTCSRNNAVPSPHAALLRAPQEPVLMDHKIQSVNCDHFKVSIVNRKLLVNKTGCTNFYKSVVLI